MEIRGINNLEKVKREEQIYNGLWKDEYVAIRNNTKQMIIVIQGNQLITSLKYKILTGDVIREEKQFSRCEPMHEYIDTVMQGNWWIVAE